MADLYEDQPDLPTTPRQGHIRESWRINSLMQKPELGQVKNTTYNLPTTDHVYGKALQREQEGAAEVIMSWNEHKANPDKQPGRDFAALNKASLKDGAVTAKSQRDYRRTHDVRLKLGTERAAMAVVPKIPSSNNDEWSYGRPTRPSTPLGDLVSHSFRWDWVTDKEMEQPQQQFHSKPEFMTKAALGHAYKPITAVEKDPFKMKKFTNINPKVVSKRIAAKPASRVATPVAASGPAGDENFMEQLPDEQ